MSIEDPKLIIAKQITWPKTSKEDRTHDKAFMKRLATTIATDGLLQAIGVRPDTAKGDGHYIGIFGRHRCEAFIVELKRDLIPAVVFPAETTEEEAAILADVENLWRNPLTQAQHARAMARWHDQYDKKRVAYEAAVAQRKAVELAAKEVAKTNAIVAKTNAMLAKIKTDEVQSGPDVASETDAEFVKCNTCGWTKPKGDPSPCPSKHTVGFSYVGKVADPLPLLVAPEPNPLPEAPPENFAKHVAAVTGQSPTAVKRALKIGKAFTPAQLEVIEQQGVNQTWQETIAGMPQEKRDAVVNLIASGRSEEESIAAVNGTPEVKRADGKEYAVAPVEPGQKDEQDMTDEEWVNFHCSEIVGLLEDPAPFIAHAILYRSTRDQRQALKSKTKTAIADAKKVGAYGGFYSLLTRLLNVAHPSKWMRCGTCNGTGFVQEGTKQKKCGDCSGNAFTIKIEGK